MQLITKIGSENAANAVIRLNPLDDVLIARQPIPKGLVLEAEGLEALNAIPSGHKIATRDLEVGEPLRRYGQIIGFAIFDVLLLAVLAVIYRPLLFSSLDEQVAQAKGVPVGFMNICFMTIMAGVITIAVPAVGTLLIFALVITPAATANIIARSPFKAMVVATVICLISIWGGLVISAMFPAPPSFIIVTISTLFWAVAKAIESFKRK